jgi:hypothetical protein
MTACNHYYKATQVQTFDPIEKAVVIDSLKHENKYFILRNGDRSYFMRNASISNDKKSITSVLLNPGVDHRLHLINGRHGKLIYNTKIPHDLRVLDEVHFYTYPDKVTTSGTYSLELNNIQQIEIIEKDKKRTMNSTIISSLVGVLGVILIFAYLIYSI